jgi:hypothetical protein
MAYKQYIISYHNTGTTKIKWNHNTSILAFRYIYIIQEPYLQESTSSRNHTSSILAFRYIGIYIIHIHSDRVYLNPNPSQYMKRKNKSREEITKTKNVKTNQVNEESIREHGHAKPSKEMMH